ncbi:Salicylate carboxymethyltransferase, partial [Bienertia sinuspersici]
MSMATELKQMFRMNEGTGETSYAKTSYIQKQVLSLTKSIKEKALREFYSKQQPTTICIADLGCSSAEDNTLNLISEFIYTIEKARRELGNNGLQEYQVYLNDLPANDFNTIFRSLGNFEAMLKEKMGDDFGHCFVNGVPGSFYGRLFPSNHLHFVHSSYSIHWMSQV